MAHWDRCTAHNRRTNCNKHQVVFVLGSWTESRGMSVTAVTGELSYEGMEIGDGTAAMDGWHKMINETDPEKQARLRQALLDYCKLDSLAMVRIFQFVEGLVGAR